MPQNDIIIAMHMSFPLNFGKFVLPIVLLSIILGKVLILTLTQVWYFFILNIYFKSCYAKSSETLENVVVSN